MNFPTRFPTIIGILLVVLLTAGIVFFFEREGRSGTLATGSATPLQVETTNVSDTTFTVSWLTADPATGAVSVSSPNAKQTLFDERDTSGSLGKYTTHAVSLRTAQPDTQYSFSILSNGKPFTRSGEPYTLRTAPALSPQSPSLEPAFGIVVDEAGQPAAGAIVYLTPTGGQTVSTLVKPSGSWLIPLNLVRTNDLGAYLPYAERIDEDILVRIGEGETLAITDTLNDNPVPDITLGKTYDFRRQQAKAPQQVAVAPPTVLGQSVQTGTFGITTPAQGAALTTDLPIIQGTGVPGKSVSLVIGITNPIGGTTTIGADGVWRHTPVQRLAPGKQSVTATSTGANGQTTAITHLFEVLKSGTQVLGVATPSGTIAPTPTQIPSSTESATLAGQPVPTSGNPIPLVMLVLLATALFAGGGAILWIG
jgi:hypothetical protein